MENENIKSVLLEIVKDLVDLRANQDLLGRLVGAGINPLGADAAKKAALKEAEKSYSKLVQKIEAL